MLNILTFRWFRFVDSIHPDEPAPWRPDVILQIQWQSDHPCVLRECRLDRLPGANHYLWSTGKTMYPILLLPPLNEVCGGYIFTGVCPQGRSPWQRPPDRDPPDKDPLDRDLPGQRTVMSRQYASTGTHSYYKYEYSAIDRKGYWRI